MRHKAGNQDTVLEGPTNGLACSQTQLALGANSKATAQGEPGTKFTDFSARAGGAGVRAALYRMDVLTTTIVPLLSAPATKPAGTSIHEICSLH